jgi:hypothetical protein
LELVLDPPQAANEAVPPAAAIAAVFLRNLRLEVFAIALILIFKVSISEQYDSLINFQRMQSTLIWQPQACQTSYSIYERLKLRGV